MFVFQGPKTWMAPQIGLSGKSDNILNANAKEYHSFSVLYTGWSREVSLMANCNVKGCHQVSVRNSEY